MERARREVLKIFGDLAVEFANTVHSPAHPAGSLHSWSDLVDFLELRGGVAPGAGAMPQALQLRETIRAMLGAMASKRSLRAPWVAEVNQALASGAGASRLLRQDTGWRLGLSPGPAGPLRVLTPIARAIADLIVSGQGVEIRKCANPRCVLYFRDRSRTRRRRWCSMAVCGNRMKVAAHVRRHGRRSLA